MNYWEPIREFSQLPSFIYKHLTAPMGPMKAYSLRYGSHYRQYLKVFEPGKAVPPRGEVIYFLHGGGWTVGSPKWRKSLAYLFTDLGYTVVMPAYRVIPFHKSPDLREDINAGFQLTLSQPFMRGKRLILIGESAGGNLAGLLLYDREKLHQFGTSQQLFAGFISVGGVLSLSMMPPSFIVKAYAGDEGKRRFREADLLTYMQEGEKTPVLVVHGTRDGLVPYPVAVDFIEKMEARNPGLAEFYTLQNATHFHTCSNWYLRRNEITVKILDWIQNLGTDFS